MRDDMKRNRLRRMSTRHVLVFRTPEVAKSSPVSEGELMRLVLVDDHAFMPDLMARVLAQQSAHPSVRPPKRSQRAENSSPTL